MAKSRFLRTPLSRPSGSVPISSTTRYNQIRLAAIPTPTGVIELRINQPARLSYRYDTDRTGPIANNGFITLQTQVVTADSEIELDEQLTGIDGSVMAEEIQFTVKDQLIVYATDESGAEVIQDFGAIGTTFLQHYFPDRKKLYPFWATFYPYNGGREIFFSGDIDPKQFTIAHDYISNSHTINEERLQTVKLKARSWSLRLKQFVTNDIRGITGVGDMTAANDYPFFIGFVPEHASEDTEMLALFSPNPLMPDNPIDGNVTDNILHHDDSKWDVAFYGCYGVPANTFGSSENYPSTFPRGTWGIKIAKIIEKICALCDYDFDPTTDIEASFELTRGVWNTLTFSYDNVPVPPNLWEVCYNYVFGVSPENGHDFTSPITYEKNAAVSSILQGLCYQLGAYIWPEIDQTTGYMRLRLKKWREPSGSVPSSWILAENSKEDVIEIGPEAVSIKNKGNDGQMICPPIDTKNMLEIEIPFRVREFGRSGPLGTSAFGRKHLVIDTKKPLNQQYLAVKRSDDGQEGRLNADGWIASSLIYYFDPSTANNYYPANVLPWPRANWGGYYALRAITEKAGTYAFRDNAYYAYCQFFGQETTGNKSIIVRNYHGVTADDGKIRSVRLNMVGAWSNWGTVENFRTIRMKRKLRSGTTELTWRTKPADFSTVADLEATFKNDANKTGGSNGGSSTTTVNNIENIRNGGGSFSIPYAKTLADARDLFALEQTGAGRAIYGKINSASNSKSAISAESNGQVAAFSAVNTRVQPLDDTKGGGVYLETQTGILISGGSKTGRLGLLVRQRNTTTFPVAPTTPAFEIIENENDILAPTLQVQSWSPHNAMRFVAGHPTSTYEALYGVVYGLGTAIKAEIQNDANSNAALVGFTTGTGAAVFGINSNALGGKGGAFLSLSDDGVYGFGGASASGGNFESINGRALRAFRDTGDSGSSLPVALIQNVSALDNAQALLVRSFSPSVSMVRLEQLNEDANSIGLDVRISGDGTAIASFPNKGRVFYGSRFHNNPSFAMFELWQGSSATTNLRAAFSLRQDAPNAAGMDIDGQIRQHVNAPVVATPIALRDAITGADTRGVGGVFTLPPVANSIGAAYIVCDATNNAGAGLPFNVTVFPSAPDVFITGGASKPITVSGGGLLFVGMNVPVTIDPSGKAWQSFTLVPA